MSEFYLTNQERSNRSSLSHKSIFIVLVAVILTFSITVTSVSASNVILISDDTYQYLMQMHNVNYFTYVQNDVHNAWTTFPIVYSTVPSVQSDGSQAPDDSPYRTSLIGRLTYPYNTNLIGYYTIPLLLSDVDSITFRLYLGTNEPTMSIYPADLFAIDYNGFVIQGATVSVDQINDRHFGTSGYNLLSADDTELTGFDYLYMYIKMYDVTITLPSDGSYDLGFIRLQTIGSVTSPVFFGLSDIYVFMDDPQISDISDTIRQNMNLLIQQLSVNNSVTNSYLSQIITIKQEDQEQVSQIQDSINELRETLDQIGEDLNSIARPPSDDFDFDVDSITDGKADFSAFQGEDSVIGQLYNDDIIGTMLKTVLSVCSIGFLCFGKR